MALFYGRNVSAPEADWGIIAAGQERGCVFNAASQHLWVYRLGIWAGRYTGTNVTTRIVIRDTDASKEPVGRLGYSAAMTVSALMVDNTGGAAYETTVELSDNAPTNGAIKLQSGKRYAIQVLGTGAQLAHSMRQASAITADNERFYSKTGLSQPPAATFLSFTDEGTQGHLSIWAVADANVAPQTPSTGLAPSGTVSETAPVFTADFRDLNGAYGPGNGGADRGDRMNQYKLQVRRVSDSSMFWDTTITASGGEVTANAMSRAYGGSALTRGTAYEWRTQQSDQFGAWSSWSAWTSFTPANLGFITLDDVPTGKQEAVTLDFKGRWNHQSATTMKRVQVRLLNASGTILQTGADYDIADVASSALPGTLFTVTWANAGFTTLAWGQSYQYQMRGYDGTSWSDWSAARAFTTDAAPTVPANLSPTGGQIFTSFPLLRCSFTDADDTTGTGLTGTARITRPDLSTVDVTLTYNAGSGKWEFQTTATELSAYGSYSWKARSFDGTVYSGEQTVAGNAVWSAASTFQYQTGPVVTISAPTEAQVLTASNPTVTWTATGQVKYQLKVYADDSTEIVYDSGLITSALQSVAIPVGYLRNNTQYDIVVEVTNAVPLTGASAIRNVSLVYTTPDSVTNVTAVPVQITSDPWETAIRISWDQTGYGTPSWQEYAVTRRADGDTATLILARITSPTQITLIDYAPASGVSYIYGVRQVILSGVDLLESALVEASPAQVDLEGVVLHLVSNGGSYRSVLHHDASRSHDRIVDEAIYKPLSGGAPVTVRSESRYWSFGGSFELYSDEFASAEQRYQDLDALDQQNGTVCYRDERGKKRYAVIEKLKVTDRRIQRYTIDLQFREEQWNEGVA